MSGWGDLLRNIFGRQDKPVESKLVTESKRKHPSTVKKQLAPPKVAQAATKDPHLPSVKMPSAADHGRRMEHALVIGLDFGTAYTKCVVRDAMVRDPGKAYPVKFQLSDGWSYLVPSVVVRQPTSLYSAFDRSIDGATDRINYLKMRLVSELDQQRADAWRDRGRATEMKQMVAWYLAQVLAGVGQEIRRRWTDFGSHPRDECFINICVPIAHADGSKVERGLLDALCAAHNAVGPGGTQAPTLEQIQAHLLDAPKLRQAQAHCYTYPETSANLQSYLKSRARQPGLYLFSDVGAGTVDLTFFQLLGDTSNDASLRYYHASVLDAGSSRLELIAKDFDPSLKLKDLIATKEGLIKNPSTRIACALSRARKQIHDEVATGVGQGVSVTEAKLHRDRQYQISQMKRIRLMHSGGGYLDDPYGSATQYFYKQRQWDNVPKSRSLPEPDDLAWGNNEKPLPFSRLSVAYGLSYARYELDGHRFPSQTAVNPDSPIREHKDRPSAPSKDEV